MRHLFLAIILLHSTGSFSKDSQVDPKKLDSLERSIEQSRKAFSAYQDSFNKKQDSIYKAAIKNSEVNTTGYNIHKPVNSRSKENTMQHSYTGIGIGLLLLVLLALVLSGKRREIF